MKKLLFAFLFLASPAFAQTQTQYYTVPTIAALKAMTTSRPAVVQVVDANPGIFNLSTGACSAADDIFQVQPTSGTTVCYTRAATPYSVGKSATNNGVWTTNGAGIATPVATLPQANDPALTGDITKFAGNAATTLATVNSNVGTFGSATQGVVFTVNGKGLVTAASTTTITPAVGSITGLGTGVATALGVNVGTAGAIVVNGGVLGTPSSGTLTNATGLPIVGGTTGTLTIGRGGTSSDLSATGGTSQVLRQSSAGAAVTVSQLAASNLSNGTTNSGSVQLAINPMAAAYGAACSGSGNDSTAFTNAFAAGSVIQLPRGVTCIVGDLVLAAGKQLDCGGSMLQAVSGSAWVIKKNGVNSWIKNCYVNDPNDYNKKSTTLSGAASAGATAVAVAATTGFANGMPVTIKLASGAYWPTKIKPTTGISGLNVTIVDPIPSSATAVAVASGGGTNCGVGTTLVVQGGSGPPTTLYVTAVTGTAVLTATISSPGLYSTAPSNPVTAVSGNNAACTATFNLTMAGASSGAEFSGGWGSLVVDQSSYGGLENITMPSCFGCIGYYSTSTSLSNPTTQENVSKVQINAARHFGVTVDAGVYVSFFKDILIYGNAHGTSNYGTVGFYRNYANPTNSSPSGGNHFSYTALTFEIGTLSTYGNLDFYEDSNTNDTSRNYGFICNGCYKNNWVGPAFNAFTGPNAYSGTGGLGVGTYFGKYTVTGGSAVPAVDNNMSSGVAGGANAADIFFSDYAADGSGTGAAVWLGSAGPNMILSGYTAALQNAPLFFTGTSGTEVGGAGTTWYLSNGIGASTTEYYASSMVHKAGVVTKFTCMSSVAPGAGQTYTCAFKDFPTPNAGSSTSRGSCSYTGAATYGCSYVGPGFYVAEQDQVAIAITSSASAPIANFKVYAAGF